MATVVPYARSGEVDSGLGVVEITAIAAGDRIDFRELLGRPARGLQVTLTDTADEMVFLLNHRRSVHGAAANRSDGVTHYSTPTQEALARQINRRDIYVSAPEFEFVGEIYESPASLPIEVFEVVSLTLSTGTTVTAVAW